MWTKLHKFISHFLGQAHKDMVGAQDEVLAEWEEMKVDLIALSDNKNYNEIFFRRK